MKSILSIIVFFSVVLAGAPRLDAQSCRSDSTCVSVKRIVEVEKSGEQKLESTPNATRTPPEGSPSAIRKNQRILNQDRVDVNEQSLSVVLKAKGRSDGEITLPPLSSYRLVRSGCGSTSLKPLGDSQPELAGKWKRGGGWGIWLQDTWCMVVHGTEVLVKGDSAGVLSLLVDGCVEIARLDSTKSLGASAAFIRARCNDQKLSQADSVRIDSLLAKGHLPLNGVSHLAFEVTKDNIKLVTDRKKIVFLGASLFSINHGLGLNIFQKATLWFKGASLPTQIGVGVVAGVVAGGAGYGANAAYKALFGGTKGSITIKLK